MNKRPKSREETPKEGSDSASATAPQQYAAALHKTQEPEAISCSILAGLANMQQVS